VSYPSLDGAITLARIHLVTQASEQYCCPSPKLPCCMITCLESGGIYVRLKNKEEMNANAHLCLKDLHLLKWKDGPIPIFVIFKDRVSVRLETLRRLYRYIRAPFEIVIIHDNSASPAAVNFMQRLKESGVHVHDNKRSWGNDFNPLDTIIAEFVEGVTCAHRTPRISY